MITVCGILITLTCHHHQHHDCQVLGAFRFTIFGTSFAAQLFAPFLTFLYSSNLIQPLRDKGERRYVRPPHPHHEGLAAVALDLENGADDNQLDFPDIYLYRRDLRCPDTLLYKHL